MQIPDYCQTTIHSAHFLSFRLPITAFGFQDTMIVEISADYFLSDDESQYFVNVWARQDPGTTKCFIMPMTIPASDHPETDIVAALNENEQFDSTMHDFIHMITKYCCD